MTATPTEDDATLLPRVLKQVDSVLDAIPATALHAPTPCAAFDVTDLVDHLVVIAHRVIDAIGTPATARSTAQPAELTERWQAASTWLAGAVDTADADALVRLPFGQMPVGAAYGFYVGEFTTHSWDLAAAIGRRDLLDETLGTLAHARVVARIPSSPRAQMPFADVVPVPADAAVYDRLAGWMGRDPAAWAHS